MASERRDLSLQSKPQQKVNTAAIAHGTQLREKGDPGADFAAASSPCGLACRSTESRKALGTGRRGSDVARNAEADSISATNAESCGRADNSRSNAASSLPSSKPRT